MTRINAATTTVVMALIFAQISWLPLSAQTAGPDPAAPAGEQSKQPERILTPAEKQEKAQRRICKVQICSIFSTQDPQGADIDCPIVKTWREEDIEDILSGGKLVWPWGKARCTTQLKLRRATLAAASGEDGAIVKLEKHTITCSLDLKSDGASYDVKIDMTPEVTFRGGKAVSARINWGAIDAPMLAYSVLWPGAKLDNSLNVLGRQVVEMTNEFMSKKCAAVKDALPKRVSLSPAPK